MPPQDTAAPVQLPLFPVTPLKVCRGCGKPQEGETFRKGRNICRLCERAKDAERRRTNGDAIRARHRGYYHADHERYLAYAAGYRAGHQGELAAKQRDRQRSDPRVAACSKRYRARNPERVKRWQRTWKAAQGPAYKAHYREWWAGYYPKQRERYLVNAGNRRALKRRAEGRYTRADLDLIHAAQRGLCIYCACPLVAPIHKDHLTPLSRGGSNWPANLALTCATCNLSKGRKSAGEFLAYLLRR